jgi:hypothetical protein
MPRKSVYATGCFHDHGKRMNESEIQSRSIEDPQWKSLNATKFIESQYKCMRTG